MVSPWHAWELTLGFLAHNARSFAATASFFGLAAGFWMAWPPLGLIIPSGFLLSALTYSHVRSQKPDA